MTPPFGVNCTRNVIHALVPYACLSLYSTNHLTLMDTVFTGPHRLLKNIKLIILIFLDNFNAWIILIQINTFNIQHDEEPRKPKSCPTKIQKRGG